MLYYDPASVRREGGSVHVVTRHVRSRAARARSPEVRAALTLDCPGRSAALHQLRTYD